MHLMFADEADQDALDKQYLLFGVIYVPSSTAIQIVKKIERIRKENGFGASDPLKFSPGKIPKGVSREAHANMKSELVEIASEYDVKAACYVVLHDVAKNQSKEDKLKWAVNTLCVNFDNFLKQNNSPSGLVFFDRTTDYKQENYFKEIMTNGLPKYDGTRIPLKRIIGIHPTSVRHLTEDSRSGSDVSCSGHET